MTQPHDPLRTAQPGERWVVRHRLPDGSATDVIGWLDQVAPTHLHLDTGTLRHVVTRTEVVAARRAPAAPGGASPERVSPEELERHAVRSWIALQEPLGEWTLRAGGGFTGRANSCHAIGDPGVAPREAADRILRFSALHSIPARAQVLPGSAPEQWLRDLGWTDSYVPTTVLAVRLADLLGQERRHPQVRVSERLEVPWWDAYGESRPSEVDPALVRLILAGHPPQAFGSAVDAGAGTATGPPVLAIGRGHLSGDWLGYAAMWTRPEHRRQGWASRVMVGLGHWAARRGARYAYLQVATENAAAVAAYERMGFRPHHHYVYLAPAG